MASKFSKFLGGLMGAGGGVSGAPAAAVEYEGFAIRPDPKREGSQWRMGGVISKELGGVVKEHAFIRADTFGAKEDADSFSIVKAKQIIDEQGDNLFRDD